MKNKKGKKLVVLGAMAALLTLIGVSGSQTYAKYVESTKVNVEQATVAKWGYVVTPNVDNLWGAKYGEVDSNLAKVVDSSEGLVVSASASRVAPGTKGSMTISVSGRPEVDSAFTFDYANLTEVHLGEVYYPMEWEIAIDDVAGTITASDTNDLLAAKADKKLETILDVLDGTEIYFDANTEVEFVITLSWSWAFQGVADSKVETLADGDGDATYTGDQADTILGVLAQGAGYSMEYDYDDVDDLAHSISVGFDITITATQTQNGYPIA